MPTTTADVVVIGAGVIGSSIAFELAQLGRSVMVVDKAGGAGLGSTSASSAVVRFNYSTWDSVASSWESVHCWADWPDYLGAADRAGLARFHRTGLVMIDVEVAPRRRVTPLFDRAGIPYEEWDSGALQARLPGIDTGRYFPPKPVDSAEFYAEAAEKLGALYTPDAGFVDDPQLAARNLASAAAERGARFLFHRRVTAVRQSGGRVTGLTLDESEQLSAPVVVNAAGPWSSAVNRLAGVGEQWRITVRPMRQEVHQVRAPVGYNGETTFGPVVADVDLGTYFRAASDDRLYIGGTEPECDPFEWVDDPDTANPRATASRFRAQVMRVARRLPALAVPNRPSGIAGVYDVASDWTPIYDRTELDGFYVAIGTSGNQFKNAPVAGQLMARLIEEVENGADHDASPVVYRGERTHNLVDIGAFSRLRELNPNSSGTVMG